MTSAAPSGDNQPSTECRPGSELLRRLASAFVLAAIALAAVLVSPWSFLALVIVAAGLLLWEWGSATRGNGFDGTSLIQAVSVTALTVFIALGRFDLGFFILGATAVVVAYSAPDRVRALWAVAGLAYVAFPAAALIWLRSDPQFGLDAILFLLAVAWTTDTASYIGGRGLGGPKLAPIISPKKTWSGFLVGILTPAIVGYGFAAYLGGTSPWILALVAIGLALACQMGDLLESAVKRHFGIKDMSQLIPGHGGLFDRIDSLLLAAVLAGLIALRDLAAPGAGLLIW
ncbi:MAG: phosphatidate cytidylyltransferase [Methyloceanibacter sp.]|uniref:phosphatidate cytidylyltransferase n=1 Tax=Methyloceanibacter sp. TaxID=1965321 RepID=UPI003EDF741F